MPTGNYSYNPWQQREEPQGSFPITEPEAYSARSGPERQAAARQSTQRVHAKEPDRQSTRRGTRTGRGRGGMEEEDQPRSRTAQRSSARRGTQARRSTTGGQTARRSAAPETRTRGQKKSRRGFAAMSPEQQREIARKGGLTVSRNRRHMADIGRIGGEHSHGGRRARR